MITFFGTFKSEGKDARLYTFNTNFPIKVGMCITHPLYRKPIEVKSIADKFHTHVDIKSKALYTLTPDTKPGENIVEIRMLSKEVATVCDEDGEAIKH